MKVREIEELLIDWLQKAIRHTNYKGDNYYTIIIMAIIIAIIRAKIMAKIIAIIIRPFFFFP